MKAIELTAAKLDAFRATTIATPEPQRGEVLIRQRAASLNFVDVAVASGNYRVPDFPLIPVADGAGEIVALGRALRISPSAIASLPMPSRAGSAVRPGLTR
ncbi:hypothetical protein NLY44_02270 [Mesorhizobium sp. C089B]|uniref:alcohol dehydrogenase catalytic domain-containing protein n=1 Tax=Mesorhizobium sp. C089B TaxID=2956823 RepID=UPI002576682B|nr:hypothetical protein [Mesorhizobium sp. C089B]WJI51570.1 hypothetical protein NLY44_02270 [Mesorhizobium sp. C089B]